MQDIRALTQPELEQALEKMGEKNFRAAQLFSWLHKNGVQSFDEMSNIPKSLKQK